MTRIWLVGDDVDTDQLAPGAYMRGGVEAIAAHCLEGLRPDFAGGVRPGDVLVGGRNFGVGSSREQAAEALKHLGLSCVVALSFAGIFYRNALNLGLPALVAPSIDGVTDGAAVEADLDAGRLHLPESGLALDLEPIPHNLRPMMEAGGLVPYLKRRFAVSA